MGAGAIGAGVFGGAVLLLAGRKFSRDSLEKRGFALWASLLFLGALSLRLYLGYSSEGFTTDLDTFKSWLTWPIPWALGRSITRTFSWTIPPAICMCWCF